MSMSALEEQFRESACYGDVDIMNSLLNAGVNVNSQNKMNGWTALHWACKVRKNFNSLYGIEKACSRRMLFHTSCFIYL